MDRATGSRPNDDVRGYVSGALRPVVLSIRNADMQGGRIFDLPPDGPVDQAPYTPWRRVRDVGLAHGLDFVTPDQLSDPRGAAVVSYDWPPATDDLVARGGELAILTSLEPPVIAWELYYKLPRISARFPHVLLWGGAAGHVAPGSAFHNLYFPQVRTARPLDSSPWQQRKWLVSISSNKGLVRSFTRWFDKPREVSVKRTLATWRYPALGDDLYIERLRAVAHFAHRDDFDMYGQGWQRRHPAVPAQLHAGALRAYRGTVPEKLETLARYRFALCFENSRFPGYVSEKIFDCFFSRTIPVYLGAPDVERYIPPDSYIDLRQFRDYAALEQFLDTLDDAGAQRYLEAADDFLHSRAYEPFTADCFAQKLVSLLT